MYNHNDETVISSLIEPTDELELSDPAGPENLKNIQEKIDGWVALNSKSGPILIYGIDEYAELKKCMPEEEIPKVDRDGDKMEY